MDAHRRVAPLQATILDATPPYSFFNRIFEAYGGIDSIHRLYSIARAKGVRTIVVENIPAAGNIADENEEIPRYCKTHGMRGLERISFWTRRFAGIDQIGSMKNQDCVGYAILKRDALTGDQFDRWHVYEAVFKKYAHRHNCVPNPATYVFRVGDCLFKIRGILYAQQSTLNKACAQVALRSLLSRYLDTPDIAYSQINGIAQKYAEGTFNPGSGLTREQIRGVLDELKVNYVDLVYELDDVDKAEVSGKYPFQKFVYSGIENGYGALLGFKLSGPKADDGACHIIPFYGHTFNKDTWAPNADLSYFHVGKNLGYLPSENWTSSFLGHDDNFGPNLCVPRLYVEADKVMYVVELLKPKMRYSGVVAEAQSLSVLYSLLDNIGSESENVWLNRLKVYAHPASQRVVLRAIGMSLRKYIEHLRSAKDWEGNTETPEILGFLRRSSDLSIYVVEISLPHLFPANERKLGEIVLNAECVPAHADPFLFARLPGSFVFRASPSSPNRTFIMVPSGFESHLPLYRSR